MYAWNETEERERYLGNGGREKKGERGRWSVFEKRSRGKKRDGLRAGEMCHV